jgi:hypothetical protein
VSQQPSADFRRSVITGIRLRRSFQHSYRIPHLYHTTPYHLQGDTGSASQGLGDTCTGQTIEVTAGRSQAMKLEEYFTNTHSALPKRIQRDTPNHQITSVTTITQ